MDHASLYNYKADLVHITNGPYHIEAPATIQNLGEVRRPSVPHGSGV
jgi:hypothetical protein